MRQVLCFGRLWNANYMMKKALTRIKGIGEFSAKRALFLLGFCSKKGADFRRLKSAPFLEQSLRKQLFIMGRELNIFRFKRKEYYKKLGNYRSVRYEQGLPVRGQRTHTNARIQKRLRTNQK